MKVQCLKGFRDYLPGEMLQKERMLASVREVFEQHGYPPLMTPALEYAEVLTGKYGDEGEMLLYRFRDNGDRDVALRYDLTVPLARVLAEHGNIGMPFRRYQIAPVWRAEKPARGRFREFMQCDVDLIGVDSAAADAEMLVIGAAVMQRFGIENYKLRINHRGVLSALCRKVGLEGSAEGDFLRILDKLDKIGEEKFRQEVSGIPGLDASGLDSVLAVVLDASSDPREVLSHIEKNLGSDDLATSAIQRMTEILDIVEAAGIGKYCQIDPAIARGLSYYTGLVYETFLDDLPQVGSVMSGGRYDDLVGMFSGKELPAIGISLGIDRLFYALSEMGLIETSSQPAEVLVVLFSEESAPASFSAASGLRHEGINTMVYPKAAKVKKQLQFAQKSGIPYVVVIGDEELKKGTVQFRDMDAGSQDEISLSDAVTRIKTGQTS
ncbi:MAG: histidine--tRNA ligase [Planctomycetia bacterium]|nr:histidine--tRNA ligase [Planctomycetia bacterium]MBL6913838.1 histidine--tRNA ligase [Planctomycetota bacterium]HCW45330.1 histidine--tRNA ligase [Planctomycetota bacterium]